jgi:putative glutamine amidotransferase
MRPLIGIPCATVRRAGTQPPLQAGAPLYVRAVEEAGGIPVLLPLYDDPVCVTDLQGKLDGVLLAGGGDVDPRCYAQDPRPETQPPDAARDQVELALVAAAIRWRIPVLGICRGMQVLNVARGGTLYQDIRAQMPGAQRHETPPGRRGECCHPIELAVDSRLGTILGGREHMVNSSHHQAVARAGTGVVFVASAPDGVIEALELPDHPFALGVQFHPERLYHADTRMRGLFVALVHACQTAERPTALPAARVV